MRQAETYLLTEERIRQFALAAVRRAPLGMAVTIARPKRTNEQNRLLWSMLQAISDSSVMFDGDRLEPDEWKDVLGSAWLKMKGRETGRLKRGLEGEPVVLGRFSSSALNTKDFAEFCDSVLAFIDTHGIYWEERPIPVPEGR